MHGRAGGVARELTARCGSAVNGTRSKESWDAPNRHVEEETLIKAYLMAWNALVENREDFMEQWTAQQAEREPIRRLSGREVHRIHRWSRNSDRDGHGLHAENTGPHQGF